VRRTVRSNAQWITCIKPLQWDARECAHAESGLVKPEYRFVTLNSDHLHAFAKRNGSVCGNSGSKKTTIIALST
jgi:hypothetical protein